MSSSITDVFKGIESARKYLNWSAVVFKRRGTDKGLNPDFIHVNSYFYSKATLDACKMGKIRPEQGCIGVETLSRAATLLEIPTNEVQKRLKAVFSHGNEIYFKSYDVDEMIKKIAKEKIVSSPVNKDGVAEKICYTPGEVTIHFGIGANQIREGIDRNKLQADFKNDETLFFSIETIIKFKNKENETNKKKTVEVINLPQALEILGCFEEEGMKKLKNIVAFKANKGKLYFRSDDVQGIATAVEGSAERASPKSSVPLSCSAVSSAATSTTSTLTATTSTSSKDVSLKRNTSSNDICTVYNREEARAYLDCGTEDFMHFVSQGLDPDFRHLGTFFYSQATLDNWKNGVESPAKKCIKVISLPRAKARLRISSNEVQERLKAVFSHGNEIYFKMDDVDEMAKWNTSSTHSKKRKTASTSLPPPPSYGIATTSTTAATFAPIPLSLVSSASTSTTSTNEEFLTGHEACRILKNKGYSEAQRNGLRPDFIVGVRDKFYFKTKINQWKLGNRTFSQSENIPVMNLDKAASKLGISPEKVKDSLPVAFSHKGVTYFKVKDIEELERKITPTSSSGSTPLPSNDTGIEVFKRDDAVKHLRCTETEFRGYQRKGLGPDYIHQNAFFYSRATLDRCKGGVGNGNHERYVKVLTLSEINTRLSATDQKGLKAVFSYGGEDYFKKDDVDAIVNSNVTPTPAKKRRTEVTSLPPSPSYGIATTSTTAATFAPLPLPPLPPDPTEETDSLGIGEIPLSCPSPVPFTATNPTDQPDQEQQDQAQPLLNWDEPLPAKDPLEALLDDSTEPLAVDFLANDK